MKKSLVILLVILLSHLLYAGAIISNFVAKKGTNQVELQWTASKEKDLKEYQVFRSRDNISYECVKCLQAELETSGESSHTYTFIDNTVFKSPSERTFYYKLKMVENNGTVLEYDLVVQATPAISAVRHTWGSIKAMFR
ncbi:hypothetical protein GF407_16265 [candidate division KSB1 bacterium]|nr:hypothetical protein [candidate division KSB1 bacterium]